MKVWCEVAFNNCHTWILKQIATRNYDLFLLCDTDLPWVKDDLREYPDLKTRRRLFNMYKDGVVNLMLQGSCSGCPSSMITLKAGIEGMMKRMIPEVKEVVAEAE